MTNVTIVDTNGEIRQTHVFIIGLNIRENKKREEAYLDSIDD